MTSLDSFPDEVVTFIHTSTERPHDSDRLRLNISELKKVMEISYDEKYETIGEFGNVSNRIYCIYGKLPWKGVQRYFAFRCEQGPTSSTKDYCLSIGDEWLHQKHPVRFSLSSLYFDQSLNRYTF